ncbi:MAG: hypothetical protein N6V41_01285, partial [Candidatus Portiera aleyrodidarum]|nr:hypothetical protein [Candidatus Portiera aleyrodidarum]
KQQQEQQQQQGALKLPVCHLVGRHFRCRKYSSSSAQQQQQQQQQHETQMCRAMSQHNTDTCAQIQCIRLAPSARLK